MSSDFVHLHLHTTYSLLDGQCQIKPLVKRAREWGMRALSVTDHGNLYALKMFYDECRSTNEKVYGTLPPIKPILGCEAYVTNHDHLNRDRDEQRFHLCLHAKNMVGYHNLVKLISEAHIHGMYYRPRIDHALLEKYHEGLHCSSACLAGEIARAITDGRMDEAERVAKWYKDVFGSDYSLEVMLHKSIVHPEMNADTYSRQVQVVKGVLELGKKLDIRVIATNDVHFLDRDDNDSHDILLYLSTGKKLSDKMGLLYTGEEWFKPVSEMERIFPETPEVLRNTLEVNEMIEEYDLDSPPIMPKFQIPLSFGTEDDTRKKYDEPTLTAMYPEGRVKKLGGYDKVIRIQFEAEYLASMVWEGAKKRWGDPLPKEIEERVQFELETIRTMGFPGYFLIVHDYINAARTKLGVWVGPGRGSAAGSAVAYSLGITNVDPLKYDLLFERFLNPDRISMPDIDVDFDDDGRGRVLEYVTQKYGQDHVAHIVTFGQMAAKSAIKDVGRVLEYPLGDTNKLASLVPDTPKITLKKARAESPELENAFHNETHFIDTNQHLSKYTVKELLDYAQRLEGSIRQPGIHACGILISRDPLIDTLPVMPTPGESLLCTQYDGHFVEPVGLLKMDFLGLKTLSVEKECVALLKEMREIDLDPDAIPVDDKETYALFGRGETTGLFQFESDGMKKYLRELQPSRLEDLVAMNALYRPGPLEYIPTFIARKQGKEPIRYDHPLMEKYLKDTYGVTVYQEQVMLQSRLLGGFTRGESDKLRKAMGKKQKATMDELKVKFIKGCLANPEFMKGKTTVKMGDAEVTLDLTKEDDAKKLIEKIWKDWEAFASYAFNKSHAVCYAWVAYQTGYMKAHYPAEFMCAQISSEIGNFDKLPGFVAEAAEMGLDVLSPCVNESRARFAPSKDGKSIRYGLAGIKGVGSAAADAIVANRKEKGPYKGFLDFVMRLAGVNVVNKRVLEALVRSGAFDSFIRDGNGMSRNRFFSNIDFAIQRASGNAKDAATGQMNMFEMLGGGEDADDNQLHEVAPWPKVKDYQDELEITGIYLSGHPLNVWQRSLKTLTTWKLPDFPKLEFGKKVPVRVGGILKSLSERMSKADPSNPKKMPKPWAIIQLDDGEIVQEALCFAKAYEKCAEVLRSHQNEPILLCGDLQHRTNRETRKEEEGVQLVVREAYALSSAIQLFGKAIRIEANHDDADLMDRLGKIRKVAESYPGSLALGVNFKFKDGTKVVIDCEGGVEPSADFLGAFNKACGAKGYTLEVKDDIYLAQPPPRPWEM